MIFRRYESLAPTTVRCTAEIRNRMQFACDAKLISPRELYKERGSAVSTVSKNRNQFGATARAWFVRAWFGIDYSTSADADELLQIVALT